MTKYYRIWFVVYILPADVLAANADRASAGITLTHIQVQHWVVNIRANCIFITDNLSILVEKNVSQHISRHPHIYETNDEKDCRCQLLASMRWLLIGTFAFYATRSEHKFENYLNIYNPPATPSSRFPHVSCHQHYAHRVTTSSMCHICYKQLPTDAQHLIIGRRKGTIRYIRNLCHKFDAFLTIWAIFQLFPELIWYLGACFIEILLYIRFMFTQNWNYTA